MQVHISYPYIPTTTNLDAKHWYCLSNTFNTYVRRYIQMDHGPHSVDPNSIENLTTRILNQREYLAYLYIGWNIFPTYTCRIVITYTTRIRSYIHTVRTHTTSTQHQALWKKKLNERGAEGRARGGAAKNQETYKRKKNTLERKKKCLSSIVPFFV